MGRPVAVTGVGVVTSLGIGKADNWRNLTALQYHYETQPLPTRFAWYFHQFPPDFQKLSAVFMFFVELLVPFLLFAPRRIRFFAAATMILLQILIFFTGNYTFFNLMSVASVTLNYGANWLRSATVERGLNVRFGLLMRF